MKNYGKMDLEIWVSEVYLYPWEEIVRKQLILRTVIRIQLCPWELVDGFSAGFERVFQIGNCERAVFDRAGRDLARRHSACGLTYWL